MRPVVVKYFWVALATLVVIISLTYLWVKLDNSCSGGPYICVSFSVWTLMGVFGISPLVLLVTSIIGLRKDFANQNLDIATKNTLKKATKIFFTVFVLGFLARFIWYFNYHSVINITDLFFPSVIFWLLACLMVCIVFIQRRINKINTVSSV